MSNVSLNGIKALMKAKSSDRNIEAIAKKPVDNVRAFVMNDLAWY